MTLRRWSQEAAHGPHGRKETGGDHSPKSIVRLFKRQLAILAGSLQDPDRSGDEDPHRRAPRAGGAVVGGDDATARLDDCEAREE
ncbi:MAG: hypothetical protein V3T05_01615 [Myxococcota bacterium]